MIDQIPSYDFVGRAADCMLHSMRNSTTEPILILHPAWEDDVKAHGWRYERFTMDCGGEALRVYPGELVSSVSPR